VEPKRSFDQNRGEESFLRTLIAPDWRMSTNTSHSELSYLTTLTL